MTTPTTAAGRALHDWWHQIGLLMLDAAQGHEHPTGCNFEPRILAIEAEASRATVERMENEGVVEWADPQHRQRFLDAEAGR